MTILCTSKKGKKQIKPVHLGQFNTELYSGNLTFHKPGYKNTEKYYKETVLQNSPFSVTINVCKQEVLPAMESFDPNCNKQKIILLAAGKGRGKSVRMDAYIQDVETSIEKNITLQENGRQGYNTARICIISAGRYVAFSSQDSPVYRSIARRYGVKFKDVIDLYLKHTG